MTEPILRIVRGDATPEELAALIALVGASAGEPDRAPTRPPRGRWNDPTHGLRRPLAFGEGGWRSAR
jgi:hypothetical protein